ncbi:MAG TPA: hypothetical protein VGO02_01130 [Burkholderiales bacterium]|jgi:hypothetical protein|nr:hypothetical protein [Burkholderiales bacterium]
MKTLILAAALLQPAVAPNAPPLYSFADVYRLTVNGAAMADFPAAAGALRVAVTPQPQPEAGFSVRAMPAPEGWLLVFSGLAAAFWVARRRLGYSY